MTRFFALIALISLTACSSNGFTAPTERTPEPTRSNSWTPDRIVRVNDPVTGRQACLNRGGAWVGLVTTWTDGTERMTYRCIEAI